ncbi:hypothetical protein GCM10027431_28160 [Lysobacter rhizosphaerae]
MSQTSQQYADLAKHVYDPTVRQGVYPPGKGPEVTFEGVTFIIREHVNNPETGYQGTIYQRKDTGDIVVAHRGTEFDREPWQDGGKADAGMVLGRANLQAPEAIELTRRAKELAQREAIFHGGYAPEVTVTGHSLGGCLAQITAHHFDLKGETFNAYGAVSLGLRIPEGGGQVINHVMAADVVSAASHHYGQVRVYATPQQIATLKHAGYENDREWLMNDRAVIVAAGGSLGYHAINNFLNVAGHHSVLNPQARDLAQHYEPMIDRYRSDVALTRGGITALSRSTVGWVQDAFDVAHGPLPPGAPAAQEAEHEAQRAYRALLAQQEHGHSEPLRSGVSLPDYLHPHGQVHAPLRQGTLDPSHPHSSHEREASHSPSNSNAARELSPVKDFDAFLDRMLDATNRGDDATFRKMTQTLADLPPGRALMAEARAEVDRQEQLAAQQQFEQQQQQQQAQQEAHHHAPRARSR